MPEGVVKKPKYSQRKKKNWRKFIDTKDVDDFLDDQRLEERIGGPLKNKPNEDLFVIDTSTNSDSLRHLSQKLTKKERARLPPRCYDALKPMTSVPDPISKRNIVKKGRTSLKSRKVTAKETYAREQRVAALKKKKKEPKSVVFKEDLWDKKDPILTEASNEMEWFTENTVHHYIRASGRTKLTVPGGLRRKKSEVPAVELPHPGVSYNPAFGDHQSLLKSVAESEREKLKKEAHLARVTTGMFAKKTPTDIHATWLSEMSQGLPCDVKKEDEIEIKTEDEDNDYKAINPPTDRLKMKTKKQRRIQRNLKEEALRRKTEKAEKKKLSDIYKLKFIANDVNEMKKKEDKTTERKKIAAASNLTRTKRLSRTPFASPDLEFNRQHEIRGNLRSMKKEGNLLADRFYSLQRRNILAPSIKNTGNKKAKVKRFVKKSHRLEDEEKKFKITKQ